MLDYFIHNDQLVIVLERPEHCCDLYDFISERPNGLDERLARDFFQQIIHILKDIHQCGVSLNLRKIFTNQFFLSIGSSSRY
jgi:serine/threonine protein kinase